MGEGHEEEKKVRREGKRGKEREREGGFEGFDDTFFSRPYRSRE